MQKCSFQAAKKSLRLANMLIEYSHSFILLPTLPIFKPFHEKFIILVSFLLIFCSHQNSLMFRSMGGLG